VETVEIVAAGEVLVVRAGGATDMDEAVRVADSLGPERCPAVFVGPGGSAALEELVAELTARSRRR